MFPPAIDIPVDENMEDWLRLERAVGECMVRRRTARGLKWGEGAVRVNVSGLFRGDRSPGT